jgi:hypothetical protein
MSKLLPKIFIHEKMETVLDYLNLKMRWIEWENVGKITKFDSIIIWNKSLLNMIDNPLNMIDNPQRLLEID